MTEETNFKAICGIATTVLGMPHGSLSLKTRKRPIQVARAASAYIAMKEDKKSLCTHVRLTVGVSTAR